MYESEQLTRKRLRRLAITKEMLVTSAITHTEGDATPSDPSWCYAWVRTVFWLCGVSHETMPKIATAKLAFAFYQSAGWEWTADRVPNLGDILFWVSPKHGRAGHVEIYIGNGLTAGNSSLNITHEGDHEARGTRPLNYGGDYRIIRPPYRDAI